MYRVIFFLFLALSQTFATTYFISATGSDSNTGLSANSPLLTFNTAFAQINNGDTLQVASGTYVFPNVAGFAQTLDKNITIIGEDSLRTILTCEGNSVAFFVIENSVSMRGLTIEKCKFGLDVFSEDNLITRIELEDMILQGNEFGFGGEELDEAVLSFRGVEFNSNENGLAVSFGYQLVVENCNFEANVHAIFVEEMRSVIITSSSFIANTGSWRFIDVDETVIDQSSFLRNNGDLSLSKTRIGVQVSRAFKRIDSNVTISRTTWRGNNNVPIVLRKVQAKLMENTFEENMGNTRQFEISDSTYVMDRGVIANGKFTSSVLYCYWSTGLVSNMVFYRNNATNGILDCTNCGVTLSGNTFDSNTPAWAMPQTCTSNK